MTATTHPALLSSRFHAVRGFSMAGCVGCYFALRVCVTFLFFQSAPRTGAIANVGLSLLMLLCAALYSFGPRVVSVSEMLRIGTARWVCCFLALGLVSILWSETPSKIVALGYWSTLAADVCVVFLLARIDGPLYTSEALLKGYIWGTVLLCIIAWSAPAMHDLRLGDDEFLNPNAIGFACATGTLLCQYFGSAEKHWRWCGAFMALTLLRSLSKTSIVAFLIAEAFYLYRISSVSRATKLKIMAGAVLSATVMSGLLLRYYDLYTNAGNQVETLTGRTSIWLATIGLAIEKPWLGYGFHAFRSVIPAFGAFEPWHAHNELLQQFFTYGVVGVVLVAVLYASFFRLCRSNRSHPFSLTGYSLLLLVVIRGLADTERFDLSFPLWALTAASLLLWKKEASV